MSRVKPIPHPLLRSEARREILRCIFDGRLAPGERIIEIELAEELDISRTPLREALIGLERDGFFCRSGRLGLYVPRLTIHDIEEICELLGALEALALRWSGLPRPETITDLERLTDEMCRATECKRAMRLDESWHGLVLDDCSNQHLLRSIAAHKEKWQHYEHAYVRSRKCAPPAGLNHKLGFLYSCRMGKVHEAATQLEDSWRSRTGPLVDWLREEEALGVLPHLRPAPSRA
ncbi:MAG: GntR family transcriptional regulator [Acidobacteriota bacterium]